MVLRVFGYGVTTFNNGFIRTQHYHSKIQLFIYCVKKTILCSSTLTTRLGFSLNSLEDHSHNILGFW